METGVSSFAIEHSKDGIQFTGIGNVPAKQINGSAYSFLHDSPGLDNYYRLKIMNTNGSADYSQVVVVKAVSLPSDMRAWYMDNAIRVAQHGDAQITVYDLNGRKVLSGILGSSDYAVDVSFLAPGSYVAHVSGMNGTATVKFVR